MAEDKYSRTSRVPIEGSAILVVGGAGFVGSNLVQLLVDSGAKHVVVVDNLLSAERANIPVHAAVEFWEGSITDESILRRLSDQFDFVFHLATFHGNQNSIHDPLADHENNTFTTLRLFERIARCKRVQKVVYSSAGCSVAMKTFDEPVATVEESPINLVQDSPYSISKIIGEFYSVYYFRRHQLPTVRARFQNVFGPKEVLGAGVWRGTAATVWRNVVPVFIYKALKGEPLPVENGGVATRDFIYVEDICRGLVACAEHGAPGEVYNLASGHEVSILELAEKINTLTANPTPLDFKPKREWDNSGRRYGATEKARTALQFKTTVAFDEGLRRTVAWTKENLDYIESVIAKHRTQLQAESR